MACGQKMHSGQQKVLQVSHNPVAFNCFEGSSQLIVWSPKEYFLLLMPWFSKYRSQSNGSSITWDDETSDSQVSLSLNESEILWVGPEKALQVILLTPRLRPTVLLGQRKMKENGGQDGNFGRYGNVPCGTNNTGSPVGEPKEDLMSSCSVHTSLSPFTTKKKS